MIKSIALQLFLDHETVQRHQQVPELLPANFAEVFMYEWTYEMKISKNHLLVVPTSKTVCVNKGVSRYN